MSKKKKPKRQKIKPPKTCGEVHGTLCERHKEPCNIPVEFDPKDTRAGWVEALHALGAESHTKDSPKHRCIKCEHEQVNHSPWRFVKVPGSTQNSPTSVEAEAIREHLESLGWDDL